MQSNTALVVGGGACGPAAAKELLMVGSDVTVIEKRDEIGGLWNLSCSETSVCADTHATTSKRPSADSSTAVDPKRLAEEAERVAKCSQAVQAGKKRVAVCGASGSGLVTAKEILEQGGFEVTLFEAKGDVGGVYSSVAAYKGAQLTTSSSIIAYGCFPCGEEDRPSYWELPKYVEYLERFADRFDLRQHIRFNTSVRRVVPLKSTDIEGNPLVAVATGPTDNYAAPDTVEVFHHFICASGITGGGTHSSPLPKWKGKERFQGRMLHSNDFKQAENFRGERVMVVGLGESGSDISLLLCEAGAKAVCIQSRNGPGYVVPRTVLGRVADLDTNRMYHGIPWWLWESFGWRSLKMWVEDQFLTPEDDLEVLSFAGALNKASKMTPKRRFGTKNVSFCRAVVKHGAVYKQSEIAEFLEDRVVFADGSHFECDAVVYCGGFGVKMPFGADREREDPGAIGRRDPTVPDLGCCIKPRDLYKRILHPELGTRFGFVGFFRPGFGSVAPAAELQARALAQVLAGKVQLPSPEVMQEVATRDRLMDLEQYCRDAPRVGALGDYATYMNSWAEMVGCQPQLLRLLLTDPRLWWRVLCGQQNALQFRLHGPGAMFKQSREALMRMPMMPLPVLFVEVFVGFLCKSLSLCGLKSFDLIGV